MKALLYTSDPYEPSGVVGLFENEEQKKAILLGYRRELIRRYVRGLQTVRFPSYYAGVLYQTRKEAFFRSIEQHLQEQLNALKEIEIPIGEYGQYF